MRALTDRQMLPSTLSPRFAVNKNMGGGEQILVGLVSRIQFFVRGVVQVVNVSCKKYTLVYNY